MAHYSQPYINWNNKIQPLVRPIIPETPELSPLKTLAAKVQDSSRHPWGVIDYHLYLAAIERGRDVLTRLEEALLLDAGGFRKVSLDDLLDADVFSRSPIETNIIVFVNMPWLPLSTLTPLTEQKLVLGFDLQRRHILGYFFESAPDNLTDIGYIWDNGQEVIDIHIDRFLEMYTYMVKEYIEVIGIGMFRYFRESQYELPTGMDLTVTIQIAQFLNDFADLLWGQKSTEFREMYSDHEEQLRTLLSKASWESWFAVQNGLTIQQYREKRINQMKLEQLVLYNLLFDHPYVSSAPSPQPSS
ncbi:hypothetical protein N7478_012667 [Penicillium angulare]|uniref:uncharacterized protein n=1 Tax=Penicillium angulare TaxID=116970 RepID=UPI0025406824|nr:uncharacterized protein N7478_012667 [Penicillium angulare]KAJ5256563.1 hypothetical protein N7478_012667 [Penicillium angulare]